MDKTKGTRFKVVEFTNPSKAIAYRVSGSKRNGERIRENFTRIEDARSRATELEIEWLGGDTPAMPKVTRLSHEHLAACERAFDRLGDEATATEILIAVEFYIERGRPKAKVEVPRLDTAAAEFNGWLDTTPTLREASKTALRLAVRMLSRYTGNPHLSSLTPEAIETALGKLPVSTTSKDVYKRGWSRFFSWAVERPRRWITSNPVREVKLEREKSGIPSILSVDQVEQLMRAAETVQKGRMAPWFALCMFGGLRPAEASRLKWEAVNLHDGEIRLEGVQTKDGKPRVAPIGKTLRAWLEAYKGIPIIYSRRHFRMVVEAAGIKEWEQDIMRHTAASHRLRESGSYAKVADEFGNSEAILKKHYNGRVSSAATMAFYSILPAKKGGTK